MTSSDQTPEQENPSSGNPQDRLEQIKKEAQEDASTYYAQGDSGEKGMTEEEFNKPVPAVESEEEEMSLLKAVAFLGFGMAALAIIFILFFIRDLNNKVGGVDNAVNTLQERFGPLKEQVETGFSKLNADVGQLKDKVGSYERMIAVLELKRAKVAIQEATANTNPDLQAKSGQVIAHIDNLLHDLGAGEAGSAPMLAPAPAPAAEAAPHAEPAVEAPAPTAEADHAPGVIQLSEQEAAPAAAEEPPAAEEPAEGGDAGGEGGDDEDEDEDDEDKE